MLQGEVFMASPVRDAAILECGDLSPLSLLSLECGDLSPLSLVFVLLSVNKQKTKSGDKSPHSKIAAAKRATPLAAFDLSQVFPELTSRSATAIRLHPRYGDEPPADASKLGGRFLWPSLRNGPR
jgi:hypothetical protein